MKRFCADDMFRPQLNHIAPWREYYVACDSKRLLAVKQSACPFTSDLDEAQHGKYPNIEAVLHPDTFRATHRIRIADLKAYISRIATEDEMEEYEVPTEYEKCPACDGDGTITIYGDDVYFRGHHYDMDQEVECPVCHGFGKVPKDPDFDPDCCDADDIENWVTYAHRPTGRKIISNDLITYVDHLPLRAAYLADLVTVMESFNVRIAEFQIVGYAITFRLPDAYLLFMGIYVDDTDTKHTILDERVPVTTIPTLRSFSYRHRRLNQI